MDGGGVTAPSLFRFKLVAKGIATLDQLKANAEANARYPRVQFGSKSGRLAVVGGGPLVVNDLPELREWDGDIWAINYTAKWLRSHGIESTLFTVDPDPFDPQFDRGIFASTCHPETMGYVNDVRVFDVFEGDGLSKVVGGRFSSSNAPYLAILMGYTEVSLFGCEASFTNTDHVDRHDGFDKRLVAKVRANGSIHLTDIEFMMQCEDLIPLFQAFPRICINRSHGLMEAMLADPDWSVVAVSEALKAHVNERNGDTGLFTSNPI
jgi:hypothetical protein